MNVSSIGLLVVVATWTPPGARIKDSLIREIYRGRNRWSADDSAKECIRWARTSTCGGCILVESFDGALLVKRDSAAVSLRTLPAARPPNHPSAGYPACVCGAPMVPPDMVGTAAALIATDEDELFCVREATGRPASAADRLRAQVAASAERRARA